MTKKSAAELKASLTVFKQDSHFATSSLPLQPSTPEMNLLMFRHNPHYSCSSQQVVFFIGRGFNLGDKGDRFGQHLVPKGDAIFRWLGEEGDHETFHYR